MAAAGKFKAYDLLKTRIENGTIDLSANAINLALFASTSNANTLSVGTNLYADLNNELATANGYTVGGIALSGKTVTNAAGVTTWTASNFAPGWTASGAGIVARFGVLYVNATVNGIVKPLVGVCLLDATPADITVTAGNPLNWTFNASGIFTTSGATVD